MNHIPVEGLPVVGVVTDAYVAKKKDVKGNFFGFVRFEGVQDVKNVLAGLNTVKINEAKINVSVALYDRDRRRFGNQPQQASRVPVSPKFQQYQKQEPRMVKKWQQTSVSKNISYRDILAGEKVQSMSNKKVVTLREKLPVYNAHCLGRPIIGEEKDVKAISYLRSMLNRGGYIDAPKCYLGGLHFMIVMKEKEMAVQFFAKKKDELWEEHFDNAVLWEGQHVETERVVELKITWLPFQFRDYEIYDQIGALFGKIVEGYEFSWAETDVSVGGCHVLTKSFGPINEKVEVVWRDNRYRANVMEADSRWFQSNIIGSILTETVSPVKSKFEENENSME
ncbi:putative nucleotide-binding alpha-beta plait domain superfamily, RNA-binding domain superfamily [Helianthus anomalus]